MEDEDIAERLREIAKLVAPKLNNAAAADLRQAAAVLDRYNRKEQA